MTTTATAPARVPWSSLKAGEVFRLLPTSPWRTVLAKGTVFHTGYSGSCRVLIETTDGERIIDSVRRKVERR